MLLINRKDLESGTIDGIEQNRIGYVGLTNKSINPGTFAQINSPSVNNDIMNLTKVLEQALTQIVGIDEQMLAGRSDNETLGQDELARSGTKTRESGIKDAIREFIIHQFKIEGCLEQEYNEGEVKGSLIPQDYQNPMLQSRNSEPQPYEFMTMANPISVKSTLNGSYFDYDMNVEEAVRPDSLSLRKALLELLEAGANPLVKSALMEGERPKRIRLDLVAEEIVKTYGQLGNPSRYIEELTTDQVVGIQMKEIMMNGGGIASQPKLGGQQKSSSPVSNPSSSQAQGEAA